MIGLAIETSHRRGSIALLDGEEVVLSEFPPGLVHGRELLPHIERAFGDRSLAPDALDWIAVSRGPGSYTGIRIGVAAAKSLAWALSVPVLGISSLEAIARGAVTSGAVGEGDEFAVLVDARRGSCYRARFRAPRAGLERVQPDGLSSCRAYLEGLPAGITLVGTGARTIPGADAFARACEPAESPDARATLALARSWVDDIERAARVAPVEYSDPHALTPVYFRPSEAEEKRRARLEGKTPE